MCERIKIDDGFHTSNLRNEGHLAVQTGHVQLCVEVVGLAAREIGRQTARQLARQAIRQRAVMQHDVGQAWGERTA